MDPSIKKKPEKPRMFPMVSGTAWVCYCPQAMCMQPTGPAAYQLWQRTRAALNKHEGK